MTCPYCDQPINLLAIKCRYCQKWLVKRPNPPSKFNTKTKKVIVAFLAIYFLFVTGCLNPFFTQYIHNRIKIGMTVEETINILQNGHPYIMFGNCPVYLINTLATSIDEFKKEISSAKKLGVRNPNFSAKINVCFMGPYVNHNTFEIYFSIDGKVNAITDVKHWD